MKSFFSISISACSLASFSIFSKKFSSKKSPPAFNIHDQSPFPNFSQKSARLSLLRFRSCFISSLLIAFPKLLQSRLHSLDIEASSTGKGYTNQL